MMRSISAAALCAALLAPLSSVQAGEADFLNTLDGKWSGTGTVLVRTDSKPISVKCSFDSNAKGDSLSLDGNCRGLVIFSRAVKANLKASGAKYAGSYVGAGTGKAGLSGSRKGNAINLGIRWAKEVNGDRKALMTVQKVGDNGMTLTTVDVDPKSGKSVVTSKIKLRRT